MNLDTYSELMDTLPGAFPTSQPKDFEKTKADWWPDLKGYEDRDLIRGIPEVRRTAKGVFPALGTVIDILERIKQERLELEYRNRKSQEASFTGVYTPKDISDPADKEMAQDTFRAITEGLSTGPSGIVEEMRRLAEKYPKKRDWFNHTAFLVEQDHNEVKERDKAIHGAHKCPEARAAVVGITTAKTCQKCKAEIEKGLWCDPCRTALYKAKEAVLAERIGG